MLIDSMENENEKQDVTIITPGQPDSESVDENERLTADNCWCAPISLPSSKTVELMKKHLLPDEADYEIEEEAVHTWEIKGWRKLERKAHGPIFQCGGTPWRVLFFPQGNNVDHASFYLEHGFEDKPPENWYRCVCFGLVLWNPKDPSIHISHQANHRFTIEEGDWGFTRFYELRNLFAKTKDFDRPLVEDDYANLTAYVRVVKDPTGVLWHNFSNYDSKKETGYVGLKNQGATCYLNSLLQSLYFTNSFRKAVYQIPTESENLTNSALTLQRLFFRLQFSDEAVSTDELTKSFGWETQDIFAQQDVQELNRVLMENLEQKMKGTGVENFLTKLFVGKTKTYIKCINVDYTSERIEDFWDIQLNVRNFKNLHESFLDYIAVETMDGENKYFAEGHGLQDARKGVIFESFPEVLHLHLKRFEYDLNTYAMQKVNDHYEFPESFDAAPYLSEDADKSESYEYVLHGVLVHSGDLNAGHYYAFLRPQKDGDFFKFDDDRVTRATMKETMDENFGGDYAPGVNGARMRNQYTRAISVKRSMNAYMLVYLRKTKIDEILVPVDKEDTPPHLEQKINEEKLLKEQKKREKDEQHLYLNVRVIGEKQFKAHQGFDLASWDDRDQAQEAQPKTYRVLKASPVRDLVEKVAADLEADPQDVRLWVMVNRQNKTIRPDQPLTNLDMSIEEAATKLGSKSDALRIWAEQAKVADPRSNYEPWAQPRDNIPWIIVFLKYYDAENDALRGLTHVYMRKTDKVNDLFPYILNEMEWPSSVPIKLYEEIKPTMIEPMRPKQTFVQAEIQDGDIICFQKAHTEKEQLALLQSSQMPDAKDFYDHLVNKIVVKFLPRHKTEPEGKTFELMLNKKMTYDQLADKVGTYLDAPPTHLRFTGVNPSNGMPRTALKRTTNANLNNMLTNQYYSQAPTNSNTLYYEVLEMSLTELETKKTLKITYLPDGISKAEPVEVLVSKSGSIQETVPLLQKKLELDDDVAARIRFFEAHYGKLHKELDSTFNVAGITDYVTVYAEKIPDEELDMTDGDRFIAAWHFQKEPSQTHKQGIPFKFVVKNGELFEKTKERLQARTGIKGKMFEKIKFAVVKKAAYSKPIYLADDDILSDIATDADDTLGLDHMDRNSHSNGWGRTGGPEIRIK
ncbi:ubiquitin-specific protease ubp15 [Rhizina undulata]